MNFVDFYRQNSPDVNLDLDQIRHACNKRKIGLGFQDGYVRFSRGGICVLTELGVWWNSSITESEIVFAPTMMVRDANAPYKELELEIFEELGLACIRVQLPEKIVILPTPSWVQVVSEDHYWGYGEKHMFLSEAKEAVEALNSQVQEIIGE